MKKKLSVGKILIFLALLVYTIFLLFPIATILITSLTPHEELIKSEDFVWWSKNFSLDAYFRIFEYDDYARQTGLPGLLLGLINTLWMTLIPLVAGLIVSGFSAYAFSKMKFPFKEPLFKISVILRAVPLGAFGVISYIFYTAIGWTEDGLNMLPLVVPGMLGSLGTMFFLRLFFDGIPNALIEAATLDGAGFFKCFTKIMLPLAKPAFIAQFIFGFVGGYNSYMAPLLYLENDQRLVTVQLYLTKVTDMFPGEENVYCAAAILGMLPLIIIYCFLQKYFIDGVAAGSVKE